RGPIRGKTVAWTGDSNNVLASWMHAAQRFEFRLRVASPSELAAKKWLLDWVKTSGASIQIGQDPEEAVRGADCIVTDTWVSMGDKDGAVRHNLLRPYQVNARLMALARPDAIFMHCLPAQWGQRGPGRGDGGPQLGGIRGGRKPPACTKGHSRLVPERRTALKILADHDQSGCAAEHPRIKFTARVAFAAAGFYI